MYNINSYTVNELNIAESFVYLLWMLDIAPKGKHPYLGYQMRMVLDYRDFLSRHSREKNI